jgi:hypothetical protein
MSMPERLRRVVDEEVRRSLRAELDARGLLLSRPDSEATGADAARSGAALLRRLLELGYPESGQVDRRTEVQFADEHAATRIGLALEFGAVTADLLTPAERDADVGRGEAIAVACAVFNVGVGLVDGICDSTPAVGLCLLDAIGAADLVGAARAGALDHRLRQDLPAPLAWDPGVQFTLRVVETFFGLLHSSYPSGGGLAVRDQVGARLVAALDAERETVDRSVALADRDRLVEYSRRTSVLPFQVIEILATGDPALPATTAGTLIGEAMWRIDDLVDLVQDADQGALNGVLLAGTADQSAAADCGGAADLERVLAARVIPKIAAQAADLLDAGLADAPGGTPAQDGRRMFLWFVQRYAGLQPTGVSSPTGFPRP